MTTVPPTFVKPATLLFLHIPKAAGTTFAGIVQRQAAPDATYRLHPSQPQPTIEAFRQMPVEQRQRYRLVSGHMPFGLHTLVPGPAAYITLLRDPVERIISYYYFVLASPEHYLYKRVTSQTISLTDFVGKRLSTELDNGQTRLLAASDARQLQAPFGALTSADLDRALHHLDEHVVVAGLVERFDATLLLLRARLGWLYRTLLYTPVNQTVARLPLEAVAPETLAVIRAHQQLDLELYAHARRRFETQLATHVTQAEDEVARLARWNRVYQASADWWRRLRRAVPKPLMERARLWKRRRLSR